MAVLAAFAVPHPPLIIPAVGKGEERGIQATIDAYEEVGRRIADLDPDTIVISSPHAQMYADYLHVSPGAHARGSFARFGAAQERYQVDYDQEFVRALCDACQTADIPAGTDGERDPSLDHATMIPLHFVQQAYERAGRSFDVPIVRMGISGLSPAVHYRMGQLVQQVARQLGRRIVYVASGDLSHKLLDSGPYGYAPEGPVFDQRICDVFRTGSFLDILTLDPSLCERAAECGWRSFMIMAGALDRTAVRPELLSHEGPFGVGYGVAAFTPTGPEGADASRDFLEQYQRWHEADMARRRSHEDPYVRLARQSLETFVGEGRIVQPPADTPTELLERRAGCFVSLKRDGQLRGCIGTISPTRANLAQEICANAIAAGVHDPRFPRVRPQELGELVYDVDVLGEPERIADAGQLDVRRYGVIVSTSDGRRGLLLPDLDGVDTVEDQVRIAARKGGIDPHDPDVQLERFEVVRHV